MFNLSRAARVVVLAVALVATLGAAVPARADNCYWHCWWWTSEGCGYEQYICEPEYDVWQYVEPSWCLYEHGSQVSLQYSGSAIVAWYVHSANSPMEPQPWNYVVNDSTGCYLLIIFP